MKAKSLMTAALTLSFLLVSAKAFAETVSSNGLKWTPSILSGASYSHVPNGVPLSKLVLASDRAHGWGWGTLLEHGHKPASSLHLHFSSRGLGLSALAEDSEDEDAVFVAPNAGGSLTFTLIPTGPVAEVPEPTPLILLGTSLFALAVWKVIYSRIVRE